MSVWHAGHRRRRRKCGACGHHFTLRYPKWFSSYSKCSQCHNRTKSSTESVLAAATTTSSGSARVVELRVLHLPSGVHEGSSAHRGERLVVKRVVVKRLVERRLQQFWRRRIGWWRRQQGY